MKKKFFGYIAFAFLILLWVFIGYPNLFGFPPAPFSALASHEIQFSSRIADGNNRSLRLTSVNGSIPDHDKTKLLIIGFEARPVSPNAIFHSGFSRPRTTWYYRRVGDGTWQNLAYNSGLPVQLAGEAAGDSGINDGEFVTQAERVVPDVGSEGTCTTGALAFQTSLTEHTVQQSLEVQNSGVDANECSESQVLVDFNGTNIGEVFEFRVRQEYINSGGGLSGEFLVLPSRVTIATFAPVIHSVIAPGSATVGESITFTTSWSDSDVGDTVKIYVCDSSGFAAGACAVKTYVESTLPPFTGVSPVALQYTVVQSDAGRINYSVHACDQRGACSPGTIGMVGVDASPTTIDPTDDPLTGYNHWAWNDVIGWIDFCMPNAVGTSCITNTDTAPPELTGYASSSIGYIALNCNSPGAPLFLTDCSTNWKVMRDPANGTLSGWAWNDVIGWISFCGNSQGLTEGGSVWDDVTDPLNPKWVCPSPSAYGVSIPSDQFTGWAWNDVIGWISFNCSQLSGSTCDRVNYKTKTVAPITPQTGWLESSTIQMSAEGAKLNYIQWQGQLNGGEVTFQIATDCAGGASTPCADGSWDFSSDFIPDPINNRIIFGPSEYKDKKYVRYRVTLTASPAIPPTSPVVTNVILNWSP